MILTSVTESISRSLRPYGGRGFLLFALALGACTSDSDTTADDVAHATAAGICSPGQAKAALDRLLQLPISPSHMFGDSTGADFRGISLESMQRSYCDADFIGEDEANTTVGWGSAQGYSVVVSYQKTTHRIDSFRLDTGYKGSLDFASRPTSLDDPTKPNPAGQHTYSIGVGRPVLRDGVPWTLRWMRACTPTDPDCWEQQATEIFDALMYTFAPELPSTQTSCIKQQSCLTARSGSGAAFGVRPLGVYFFVPDLEANASAPRYIFGSPLKLMPFSLADASLRLDGSKITAVDLGQRRSTCELSLGTTFDTFVRDCASVSSDAKVNAELKAQLLRGLSRSIASGDGTTNAAPSPSGALSATWVLDLAGVRPSFPSERFDETAPSGSAAANELVFDRWSSGKILNDYSADGSTLTFTGTGAVYREYTRLVQDFLHASTSPLLPKLPLGDRRCLLAPGQDAPTWRPAEGCTGIEQLVSPADPSTTDDPRFKGTSTGAELAARLGFSSALRPSDVIGVFCADPGTFKYCRVGEGGLFSATRARAVAQLGGGAPVNLSDAVRDRKTYVRLWVKALIKHLRAPEAADLSSASFDALTPEDSELSLETLHNDLVRVRYRNKLEIQVHYLSGSTELLVLR